MKLNFQAIIQSIIAASVLAIAGAAVSSYVEVKAIRVELQALREDVQRQEVYIDQLWHEPRRPAENPHQ